MVEFEDCGRGKVGAGGVKRESVARDGKYDGRKGGVWFPGEEGDEHAPPFCSDVGSKGTWMSVVSCLVLVLCPMGRWRL